MALKDVCHLPSVRVLTRKLTDSHVSHKPTLLNIDWNSVSVEEFHMMSTQWVILHWQEFIRGQDDAIPENFTVSVRWLLDRQHEKETPSEAIPEAWKCKEKTPQEILEDSISKMSVAERKELLAQLSQLNN